MKEILKKLRKYEIRIRKAINNQMQGDFHSIFKGSGLEFDDVRAYQYGDDVRTIDWNVSAKGHGTFVKTFKEEKEQTVFFMLDVSASQKIGKPGKQKIDIGKEICALLCMSAIKENSQAGLLCYSDQKEKYVKPGKGQKHAHLLANQIFKLIPSSSKTNLKEAFKTSLKMLKRRSIVILISDFIDEGYEDMLKQLAFKHDLVIIHLGDQQETNLPKMGIIPLIDRETNRTIWVNSSSSQFREKLDRTFGINQEALQTLCQRNQIDYLYINTAEDYVPKLIKLFKVRNKSKKSA